MNPVGTKNDPIQKNMTLPHYVAHHLWQSKMRQANSLIQNLSKSRFLMS